MVCWIQWYTLITILGPYEAFTSPFGGALFLEIQCTNPAGRVGALDFQCCLQKAFWKAYWLAAVHGMNHHGFMHIKNP